MRREGGIGGVLVLAFGIAIGGGLAALGQATSNKRIILSDEFTDNAKSSVVQQRDFCDELTRFIKELNEESQKGKGPAFTFDCSALQPK